MNFSLILSIILIILRFKMLQSKMQMLNWMFFSLSWLESYCNPIPMKTPFNLSSIGERCNSAVLVNERQFTFSFLPFYSSMKSKVKNFLYFLNDKIKLKVNFHFFLTTKLKSLDTILIRKSIFVFVKVTNIIIRIFVFVCQKCQNSKVNVCRRKIYSS